jgi:hypothetical protein
LISVLRKKTRPEADGDRAAGSNSRPLLTWTTALNHSSLSAARLSSTRLAAFGPVAFRPFLAESLAFSGENYGRYQRKLGAKTN